MGSRSVEPSIETIRRGAEACERALGVTTERDLVRALVRSFPTCHGDGASCGAIATWSHGACDRHRWRIDGFGAVELPWAPALRALTERMKAWSAPMPGAGEALLGGEGCE